MVTAAMKLKDLLLGRKVMNNLGSILKSRDITLPTKVHLVKATVFPVVMHGYESWTLKEAERRRIDGFWKDWCWSWNSSTLATWSKGLTHWKRPWCWEGLRAGEEGDDRGWDGWMASPTQWRWVWVNSRSWWWTGGPGVLQSMGCKESYTTEWLNWTESVLNWLHSCIVSFKILRWVLCFEF